MVREIPREAGHPAMADDPREEKLLEAEQTIERQARDITGLKLNAESMEEDLTAQLHIAEERIGDLTSDIVAAAQERNRAEQGLQRIADENGKLRDENATLSVENRRLASRFEDERKRKEMATICLDDWNHINTLRIRNRQPRIALAECIELARVVLDERELRAECESCQGPCSVDGTRCLLCGVAQPPASDSECPARDQSSARLLAGR